MQTPYKEIVDEDVGYWFQIRSKSVRALDLYIVHFSDSARQVILVQVLYKDVTNHTLADGGEIQIF